jgi:hypothetical protein
MQHQPGRARPQNRRQNQTLNQSLGPKLDPSREKDEFLFALLIDASKSSVPTEPAIKDSAIRIFERLTDRGGLGYRIPFNHNVASSKQPPTVAAARSSVDKVSFGGGTAIFDAIEQIAKGR